MDQKERDALEAIRAALVVLREIDPIMPVSRAELLLTLALAEPGQPVANHQHATGQAYSTLLRNAQAFGETANRGRDGYRLMQPALTREQDGQVRLEPTKAGNKLFRDLVKALRGD